MIYAELSGGLGNQMFVYAFARAMGLRCREPVALIDRQDWKTGSPAHTALALQALHISSEVQFITDAGFAKQHLPVQNAAKAKGDKSDPVAAWLASGGERIARLRDRLQALTEGDVTVSKLSVAAGLMGDLV